MRLLLLFALTIPTISSAETSPDFDAAQARLIEEMRLDAMVRQYEEKVKDSSDLARVFPYGKAHKYQGDWMRAARAAGPLPRLSREGLSLVLHFDVGDVRLDLSDLTSKNIVVINGVRWAYDPSAPPRLHADLLQAKLRAASRGTAREARSIWGGLIPEAHAGMPDLLKPAVQEVAKPTVQKAVLEKLCKGSCTVLGVMVTASSLVVGVVQDTGTKWGCYLAYSTNFKAPFRAGLCEPWLESYLNREKKDRDRSIANWGAMKGKLKWVSDPNPKCMAKDEKGNELYSFHMTEIGPNATTSKDKLYFVGKGSNGLLTDAAVYRNEDDSKKADAAQRALAQYIFNEDSVQTASGVPPPLNYVRVLDTDKKDLSAGDSGYTMVDLSKRPKDVPVNVADRVFRYVALITNAQRWLIACQQISESASLNPTVVEDTVKTIITNGAEKKLNQQPEDNSAGTAH